MIEDWFAFCVRMGAGFETANRGLDILNEREPDGSTPNVDYYRRQGWQALLDAVESEHQPVRRQIQREVRI